MTREQAIEKLVECQQNRDTENAHLDADKVLCEMLISLGFKDVVNAWEPVHKWYA
jgi:hypothetical protein